MSTDNTNSSVAEMLRSPFEDLLTPDPDTAPAPDAVTPSLAPTPDPVTPASDVAPDGPGMIGTPSHDALEWDGQQSFPNDCAVRSQQFILEQFTDQKFDETSLVQEATDAGIYTSEGGTRIADVGRLLEMHGIHVHHTDNATVDDLANELAHGHKVICCVDADKLWGQIPDGAPGQANHAVVVSGIDTTDPSNIQVIVDDPGTGQISTYPIDHFLAAWSDGGDPLMATDDPAPPTALGMTNFDYTAGHIPEVAGIPYDEFQTMREQPGFLDAFSRLVHEISGLGQDTHTDAAPTDLGNGSASGDSLHGLSGDDGVHLNSVDVTPGNEDGHLLVNINADIDTSHLDPSLTSSWPSGSVSLQDVHLTPGDSDGVYHMNMLADIAPAGDEAFHG